MLVDKMAARQDCSLCTLGVALLIALLVNFASARHPASDFTCNRGFYVSKDLQGLPVCKMCEPGTFISEDNHQNINCAICTEAKDYNHEVTYQPCSSSRDTVIGCDKGYFRHEFNHDVKVNMNREGLCKKCMDCEKWAQYEYRSCGFDQDTVCCPEPNMVRVDRGQGPECLFKDKESYRAHLMSNYNIIPTD